MKRDLKALHSAEFDVLVVGGGVHGASVARDAALRGLSVGLVEQGDFSSATSHNSLKTIHGGIRYLQHLNVKRTVESILEQEVYLRTAPHLVQPLRFLMPCYGWGTRGPVVTAVGVLVFELLGLVTRLFSGRRPRMLAGAAVSPSRALTLAPGLDTQNLTGGAIWLDAQVSLADKAALLMLQQAAQHEAIIANYVKAESLDFQSDGQRVVGIQARDMRTGNSFPVKAKLVINAAGPWVGEWVARNEDLSKEPSAGASSDGSEVSHSLEVGLVKSMNILVNKPAPSLAFGIKSNLPSDSKVDTASRMYFAVPWQGKTVIGTTHFTHTAKSRHLEYSGDDVQSFVDEFSSVYPDMNIAMEDVLYSYQGLTPGDDAKDSDGAKLHHSKIIDHRLEHSLEGLISIIGIKWTTARLVAERAVDVAVKHLGHGKDCQTRTRALPDDESAPHQTHDLSDDGLRDFVVTHVETTQAHQLTDIVLRRTNDLLLGDMSAARVRIVLEQLSECFEWSSEEQRNQLSELMASGIGTALRTQMAEEFQELNQ